MLHNSTSADMKVYALQLKQKSTAGVPSGILRNFRAATFENIFGELLQWPLRFLVFTFSGAVIYEVIKKQCSFFTNFLIAEPFHLDYVIHFYIPKKGLSSSAFSIKILVIEIFGSISQIIKVLSGNISRVNECATMPSVNNVTTAIWWINKPRVFQTFLPFCVQAYSFLGFFSSNLVLFKKNLISLLF